MVEIYLYGKLRQYHANSGSDHAYVTRLEPDHDETIASLLARAGIPDCEIQHIFFNSKLLTSRSKLAAFMGYQQTRSSPCDWDLHVPVQSGDRLGLFGTDVALIE